MKVIICLFASVSGLKRVDLASIQAELKTLIPAGTMQPVNNQFREKYLETVKAMDSEISRNPWVCDEKEKRLIALAQELIEAGKGSFAATTVDQGSTSQIAWGLLDWATGEVRKDCVFSQTSIEYLAIKDHVMLDIVGTKQWESMRPKLQRFLAKRVEDIAKSGGIDENFQEKFLKKFDEKFGTKDVGLPEKARGWLAEFVAILEFLNSPAMLAFRKTVNKVKSAAYPARAEYDLINAAMTLVSDPETPSWKFREVWRLMDAGTEGLRRKFAAWPSSDKALKFKMLRGFFSENHTELFPKMAGLVDPSTAKGVVASLPNSLTSTVEDILAFPDRIREFKKFVERIHADTQESELIELLKQIPASSVWTRLARFELLDWGLQKLREKRPQITPNTHAYRFIALAAYISELARKGEDSAVVWGLMSFMDNVLVVRDESELNDAVQKSRREYGKEMKHYIDQIFEIALFDPMKPIQDIVDNAIGTLSVEAIDLAELELLEAGLASVEKHKPWTYLRVWGLLDEALQQLTNYYGMRQVNWASRPQVELINLLRKVIVSRGVFERDYIALFEHYRSHLEDPRSTLEYFELPNEEDLRQAFSHHSMMARFSCVTLDQVVPVQESPALLPMRQAFLPTISEKDKSFHKYISGFLDSQRAFDLEHSEIYAPWLLYPFDAFEDPDSRQQSFLVLDRAKVVKKNVIIYPVKDRRDLIVKYQSTCATPFLTVTELMRDFWFLKIAGPLGISPQVYWLSPPAKFPVFRPEKINFKMSSSDWELCAIDPRSHVRFMVMERIAYTVDNVVYREKDAPVALTYGGGARRIIAALHMAMGILKKVKLLHTHDPAVIHGDIHVGNVAVRAGLKRESTPEPEDFVLIDFGRAFFESERAGGDQWFPWRSHCFLSHYNLDGFRLGYRDDVYKTLLTAAFLMNGEPLLKYCVELAAREDNAESIKKFHREVFIFDMPATIFGEHTGRFEDSIEDAFPKVPENKRDIVRTHLRNALQIARNVKNVRDLPRHDDVIRELQSALAMINTFKNKN